MSLSRFPILIKGAVHRELPQVKRFVPFSLLRVHISQSELKAFGNIYFDLINATAEKDLAYLEYLLV
jgi:hypothetical protein